jgi:hypothetical protein
MINDRLHGLHEDQLRTEAIPVLRSDWQSEVTDRLIETARDQGIEVQRPRRGAPHVGEARPSSMAILGQMTGRPDFANLYYRNTSGIAHAALHTLSQRLDVRTRDEGGTSQYRTNPRRFSIEEATADIALSLVALRISARALVLQTGWDLGAFEEAEGQLHAVLGTLLDA